MPFADNNGVKIYYEVEGEGEPVLFHHGITGSTANWEEYPQRLKETFQCILIDARGHGKSDKPQQLEEYSPELMTDDAVAVLDELNIEKVNWVGYSMGGIIGSAMTKFHPDRLKRLVVGGASPIGIVGAQKAVIEILAKAIKAGAESGPEAFIEVAEKTFGPPTPERRARYLGQHKSDFRAHHYVLTSLLTGSTDFSTSFRALNSPKLIFIGDQDEFFADLAKNGSELFPNTQLDVLAGFKHVDDYLETVIAIVRGFLK